VNDNLRISFNKRIGLRHGFNTSHSEQESVGVKEFDTPERNVPKKGKSHRAGVSVHCSIDEEWSVRSYLFIDDKKVSAGRLKKCEGVDEALSEAQDRIEKLRG